MSLLSLILNLCLFSKHIRPLRALPTQINLTFRPSEKPKVVFNRHGSFKITVLSDVHMGEDAWTRWGPEQDRKTVALLRMVLQEEAMDYIVLNGDQITGGDTYKHNSTMYIDKLVGPLTEAGVPFSSVHGNHDNGANITHLAEIEREQLVAPHSYTRRSPEGVGGEGGEGNYWVPVYKHPHDHAPALILWFFDSRGGYSPGPDSHPVDDWVHHSVAQWIQTEAELMNQAWGPAVSRGALAFVHIPPFLVRSLQANLNSTISPGLNADPMDKDPGATQHQGKDHAFWKALTTYIPNLHALISGHEHGNEWCARERRDRVVFCFAKHSGYGGYGGPTQYPGWGFGVRNLVFEGFDATTSMRTWIRMENGQVKGMLDINDAFDS